MKRGQASMMNRKWYYFSLTLDRWAILLQTRRKRLYRQPFSIQVLRQRRCPSDHEDQGKVISCFSRHPPFLSMCSASFLDILAKLTHILRPSIGDRQDSFVVPHGQREQPLNRRQMTQMAEQERSNLADERHVRSCTRPRPPVLIHVSPGTAKRRPWTSAVMRGPNNDSEVGGRTWATRWCLLSDCRCIARPR
jgi:hypothetical protein